MILRHSVMVSLMGRQADRFHEYQPARPLAERLEMAARVPGAEGVEIVYPQDFADEEETIRLVQSSGLAVSAVNLNVKGESKWRSGSFTARDAAVRAEAVRYLKKAMELALALGADMVTCCPLIDGHNYAFQADYLKQWRWLEEGLAEGAAHRPQVKISLEYKLNEARNYIVLGDVGRALYLCERLGLPNVGITMDMGHALLAKEAPAEALCLAAQAGRLFYLHLNDNAREWDWDMIPGAVNWWDLLETVYYLDRLGWEGWASYDVLSRDSDPVETIATTIEIVNTAQRLLGVIGREEIQRWIEEGTPAETFRHLVRALFGRPNSG